MGVWVSGGRILAALLFFVLCRQAVAEPADRTVTLSFAETNAPYAWIKDGQVQGLEFDIMSSAFALVGYRVEAVARPYLRLSTILLNEKIDGATGLHPDELPDYYFSQPYMSYENYAIVRKDSGIDLQRTADLFSHTVAAWKGASKILGFERDLSATLAAAKDKTYLEFADQSVSYRYFWNRRADVLLSDKYIYERYLREHPESAATAPPVTYLPIFPENAVSVAFKSPHLRDEFEEGLRRLKENGGYRHLFDQYFPPELRSTHGRY